MAWRLIKKTRKAPPGMDLLLPTLEDYEMQLREALNDPPGEKRRTEITWPIHKIHYKKNRYLHDMHYKQHNISKKLLDFLIKEKIADGKLISKWRRPGYERLCSLQVITKSNMNYGGVGVCRIPLRDRKGQIMPNVLTGCVSCASGDGGPIWWDDPVPDIVKQRIKEVDPGKAALVDGDGEDDEDDEDGEEDSADDKPCVDGSNGGKDDAYREDEIQPVAGGDGD